MDNPLNYFVHAFTNLNVDSKKERGLAPHKPVLLLSVIQAYENGLINDNQIYITPELVSIFKANWNHYVISNHTLGFALPFYHLTGERGNWWELIPKPGCEVWVKAAGSMRSFTNLNAAVACAQINIKLTILLQEPLSRNLLRQAILKTYFPNSHVENSEDAKNYLSDIRKEILEEAPGEYKAKLRDLKMRLDPETYVIEVYTRDTLFRREIIRLYDDTCCVTGVRVSAPYTFSMVDACHIMPFYKTFNNHPTNGIALCPNLHRAFDKGAISVDENYKIIVSKTFSENKNTVYNLNALCQTTIILPKYKEYLPSPEAFRWHRENIFKK